VSAFIDEFGRITNRLKDSDGEELFVEGILVGDIPVSFGGTFYTQYGDLFAFLQLAVCGFLAAVALRPTALICSAGLSRPEEVPHVASAKPHTGHPG